MISRITRTLVSTSVLTAALIFGGTTHADTPSVKVTSIVEHPALDAVRDGVRDELKAAGYLPGTNLQWEYQSAQGDVGIAGQIARKFVGDSPDVIVAIATPSAQAAVAAARNSIPVVFSAVTDPVDARLVESLENPGGNVTGVSDALPLERHLALIREVVPDVKTVGVPYNPGEPNAAVIVERLKAMAPEMGIDIVTASAPDTASVLTAARSLVGEVDAIYVTTDNTIASAMESVAKVGMQSDIPVFGGDTSMVERGAAAAIGFDYYDVGRQTGKMVVDILEGGSASEMPVQTVEKTQIHLNPAMAAEMGVTLPDSLLARAFRVVE